MESSPSRMRALPRSSRSALRSTTPRPASISSALGMCSPRTGASPSSPGPPAWSAWDGLGRSGRSPGRGRHAGRRRFHPRLCREGFAGTEGDPHRGGRENRSDQGGGHAPQDPASEVPLPAAGGREGGRGDVHGADTTEEGDTGIAQSGAQAARRPAATRPGRSCRSRRCRYRWAGRTATFRSLYVRSLSDSQLSPGWRVVSSRRIYSTRTRVNVPPAWGGDDPSEARVACSDSTSVSLWMRKVDVWWPPTNSGLLASMGRKVMVEPSTS